MSKSSLTILISGASGFVGSHVRAYLKSKGHTVFSVKRWSQNSSLELDLDGHSKSMEDLNQIDAFIHLSGENIASGYWTERRKKMLKDSRIDSTKWLIEKLQRFGKIPKVFLCASAIGIYGDRKDQVLTENTNAFTNSFLSNLCINWENEANKVSLLGSRVINMRFGMILSKDGGALYKMLVPFRMGLTFKLGKRKQYLSWINITDLQRAILFCIETKQISGPVNFCTENPVVAEEFYSCLAKKLDRWSLPFVPNFLISIIFGQMGAEVFLKSARCIPDKLIQHRFRFEDSTIKKALDHIL